VVEIERLGGEVGDEALERLFSLLAQHSEQAGRLNTFARRRFSTDLGQFH